VIDSLLTNPNADPILPGPALSEVISVSRKRGNASSPQFIAKAVLAHMRVEACVTADLIRSAELYELSESRPGRPHPETGQRATLSRADALILAVVERLGVQVVTRDRYWHEFAAEGHTTAVVLDL
jgi:predicted nucleic acid-binding protein